MVTDVENLKELLELYEIPFTAENVDILTQMLHLGSFKPVEEVMLDLKRLKEQLGV